MMRREENGPELALVSEFEFVDVDGGFEVHPLGGLGNATFGADLCEAIFMAADILRCVGEDLLVRGEDAPEVTFGHTARRGGRVIAVAATVRRCDIPAMTSADAARRLGVSRARVAQLCRSGALDSWRVGSTRMVSEESVTYRLAVGCGDDSCGLTTRGADGEPAAVGA